MSILAHQETKHFLQFGPTSFIPSGDWSIRRAMQTAFGTEQQSMDRTSIQPRSAVFDARWDVKGLGKEKSGSTVPSDYCHTDEGDSKSTLATEASSSFGSNSNHSAKDGDNVSLANVSDQPSSSAIFGASKSFKFGESFCQFENDVWWEDVANEKAIDDADVDEDCHFKEIPQSKSHHGLDAASFAKPIARQRSRLAEAYRPHPPHTTAAAPITMTNPRVDVAGDRGTTSTKPLVLKECSRDTRKIVEKTGGERVLRRSSTIEPIKKERPPSFRRTGSLEYLKEKCKDVHLAAGLRNATLPATTNASLKSSRPRKPNERRSSAVGRQSSKLKLMPSPPPQRPALIRASSFESVLSSEKCVTKIHAVRASMCGASSLLDKPIGRGSGHDKQKPTKTNGTDKGSQSTELLQQFIANEPSNAQGKSDKRRTMKRSVSFESIVNPEQPVHSSGAVLPVKSQPGHLERSESSRGGGSGSTRPRRSSVTRATAVETRMARRQSSTRLMGLARENSQVNVQPLSKSSSHEKSHSRAAPPRAQSQKAPVSNDTRKDPRRIQSNREVRRERSTRMTNAEEQDTTIAWTRESSMDGAKSTAQSKHPLTARILKEQQRTSFIKAAATSTTGTASTESNGVTDAQQNTRPKMSRVSSR